MSKNRYSEIDINKINNFAEHLLSNPGIKFEPLLIGERKIINSIVQNLPQLEIIFKKSHFFPHLEKDQVLELIFENLYSRVSGIVLPVINKFVNNTDFTFMDKFSGTGTISGKFRREKLNDFVRMIFRDRDSRFNMNSTFNIFNYGVLEKYVVEIFNRGDFLHNELTMVQKINLDSSEYIILLKTMLLIRNTVCMKLPLNPSNPDAELSISEIVKSREMVNSYTNSIVKHIIPLLPGIPEMFIRLAVKSAFAADLIEQDDAAAKLVFILNSRFQNYKHIVKIERGAEPADKSWFDIAKRNADYFGYDRPILDALYLIAGDNNW